MAGERTLPGLGLKAFWNDGSNGWKPDMDQNLLMLSVLTQGAVETRLDAVPAAPANGLCYIVPTGGNATKIAVRDNGAWVYLTPQEGWRVYVKSEDAYAFFDGVLWTIEEGGSAEPEPVLEVFVNKAASHTLELTDAGAYVRFTGAGAQVLTVPPHADVALPVGTTIKVRRAGVGTLAVAAGAGVTVNTAETLILRKQHSSAALTKFSNNVWDLTGDLELAE